MGFFTQHKRSSISFAFSKFQRPWSPSSLDLARRTACNLLTHVSRMNSSFILTSRLQVQRSDFSSLYFLLSSRTIGGRTMLYPPRSFSVQHERSLDNEGYLCFSRCICVLCKAAMLIVLGNIKWWTMHSVLPTPPLLSLLLLCFLLETAGSVPFIA